MSNVLAPEPTPAEQSKIARFGFDKPEEPVTEIQKCGDCGRERTIQDAYDYSPLQVVTGQPLGWYSADDGELCPECMTSLMRRAN